MFPASVAFAMCSVLNGAHPQDVEFTGIWSGRSQTASEDTGLVIQIDEVDGRLSASMTLPDVGVTGWPATSVTTHSGAIELVFPSDSGPQPMTLSIDDGQLTGQWRDARYEEAASVALSLAPDQSRAVETRVTIDGPVGGLGASIYVPKGKGPFPGVVFFHGSGPQPRDSSRFAALTLAKLGVACAIFDKRGVGESDSGQGGASFSDLAADGIAVAQYLLALPDVSHVGFFGHSQGGWIGPIAGVNWDQTAFVITSAGPAVSPDLEGEWDVVRNMRRAGIDEIDICEVRGIIKLWYTGYYTDEWDAFEAAMASALDKQWFEVSGLAWWRRRPDRPFSERRGAREWDPVPVLRALEVPLLAILTKEDESIDTIETLDILYGLIAEGEEIRLKIYRGYDHSMRRLGADGEQLRRPEHPEDYFTIQAEFIRGISRWSGPDVGPGRRRNRDERGE